MISWWRSSWLLTRPVTLKSWTHRDLPCRMVMLGSSKDLIWDLWEYWGWTVGPSQIRLALDWINWTNWAPGQSAMARPQPIRFLVNQNQEGPLVNTKWMFIPKNICVKGHIGTYIWTKWWPVSESVATPWSLSFLSWLFSLLQTKKWFNCAIRPALTQIRTSPFTLDCSIVTSSWVDCRNFCTKLHTAKYLCLADISLSLRPCICHQCRQSACEIASCTLPAVRWWVHRRFVIVLRGLQNRTCLFMRETSSSPNQFFYQNNHQSSQWIGLTEKKTTGNHIDHIDSYCYSNIVVSCRFSMAFPSIHSGENLGIAPHLQIRSHHVQGPMDHGHGCRGGPCDAAETTWTNLDHHPMRHGWLRLTGWLLDYCWIIGLYWIIWITDSD